MQRLDIDIQAMVKQCQWKSLRSWRIVAKDKELPKPQVDRVPRSQIVARDRGSPGATFPALPRIEP